MANVNYFKNVETLEDVRVRLIQNLQNIDPKSRSFKTMVGQYEKAYAKHIADHINKKGEPYKENVETPSEEFLNIILTIMMMDGVTLERVGTWFWASGNTKSYKTELKKLGFWWNQKRAVWQWHDKKAEGNGWKSRKHSAVIKAIYGETVIKSEAEEEGAA